MNCSAMSRQPAPPWRKDYKSKGQEKCEDKGQAKDKGNPKTKAKDKPKTKDKPKNYKASESKGKGEDKGQATGKGKRKLIFVGSKEGMRRALERNKAMQQAMSHEF